MPRKSVDNRDADERREDVLRPCRYLGYDRDALGMHLVSREAYRIAESQFRRAMWLNPFESRFRIHLAWCLYKQTRVAEALKCLKDSKNEPRNRFDVRQDHCRKAAVCARVCDA